MKKLNILPQVIYKFQSDKKLLSESLKNVKNLDWRRNTYNYTSLDYNILMREEYHNLHKWMQDCLDQVKKDLDYQCDKMSITQSWANKADFKHWHHTHNHSNSVISGIYYLTNSECSTWFSIENIWNFTKVVCLNTLDNLDENECIKNTEVIHKEKSESGKLIIFPSNLRHSVSSNMSIDTRYTISFNSFPIGQLGKWDYLNKVDISLASKN